MAGGKINGGDFWTPGDGSAVDKVMTGESMKGTVAEGLEILNTAVRRVCAYVACLDREDSDPMREAIRDIILGGKPPTPATTPGAMTRGLRVMPLRPLPTSAHLRRTPREYTHPTTIVLSPAVRLPVEFGGVSFGTAISGVEPGDTYRIVFRASGVLGASDLLLPLGWVAREWSSKDIFGGVHVVETTFTLVYNGPPPGGFFGPHGPHVTVEAVADEALRRGELVRALTAEEKQARDRDEAMARLREVAAEAREHGVES